MTETLQVRTIVLPGNRIEIDAPGLAVGEPVNVTVTAAPPTTDLASTADRPASALDIIESLNGYRHFKTADEVDEYLRAERDSWER